VVGTVGTGNGANAVEVGLGSVWVANSFDGTITRIDPATDSVRAAITVGDGPNAIAITPGAVWVSNELSGTLSRIDPDRDVVVDTVKTGNRPQGLVREGGALFVAGGTFGAGHSGGRLTLLTSSGDLRGGRFLDPARAYTQTEWQVVAVTNDGLTGYRRVGGTAGSGLVSDLAVSLPAPTDGGRSYTFRLRPGIRYSTGRLVRPEDFRRAIERGLLLDGSGWWLAGIVGASTCDREAGRCDLSRGIVTDRGSNTVTFHLEAPDPDFLYKLALPAAFAVPASTPLHPRGFVPATGPYMVASFDPKHGLRLVRNPRFREWSADAQPRGIPDEIVERVKGSPDAHIRAVVDGLADVASVAWNAGTPSPSAIASVRTRHAGQLRLPPSKITWYLSLNTRVPPFDSRAARQAFNLAIDRRRLRDLTVGRELGTVTCQALPPSLAGYRRHCPYTRDPSKDGSWTAPDIERARRLVATSGTAGQKVTFLIPTFLQFGAAAGRYVVSVLESLGYEARYRFTGSDLAHGQVTVNGWGPDYTAPGGFIDPTLRCNALLNLAAFCDPDIDRAIARAHSLESTDPGAASQQWARIDRRLTDQAPWVPFANGIVLDVVSTRVGNYQYHTQWGTLLGQLWVR